MFRASIRSGCHPASLPILLLLICFLLVSCGGVPDQNTTTRLAASPNLAQPIILADAPALEVKPLTMPKVSRPSRSRGTFGPPGPSLHTTERISRSTGDFNDKQSKIPGCPDPPVSNNRPRRGPVYPLLSPSWSCVYVGETLQFSSAATGSPTWSVNGAVGGNSTVGTISVTGLYTAPATVPYPSMVDITLATASGSASANVTVLEIPQRLELFTVTSGGSGSDYTDVYDSGGNPITIGHDEYVFSQITPSTLSWVVHDRHTSVEYARSVVKPFRQDSQIFEATIYSTDCDFQSIYNPDGAPLAQFNLRYPGSNDFGACALDHLGLVDTSIYWQIPFNQDWFFPEGGQFVVIKNGTTTTLLPRNDPDNRATIDVADYGTLYAVIHSSEYKFLTTYTRDPATGKLATNLGWFDTTDTEANYSSWSFNIDDAYLYVVRIRKADQVLEVLMTDLLDPQSNLEPVATFRTDTYGYGWRWAVNNYHVVLTFKQPGKNNASIVADIDLLTGDIGYWSLGDDTSILDIAAVFR